MKRIKQVGIAAVMAMALTGILGASSASAETFVADEYPANLEAPKATHQMALAGNTWYRQCEVGAMSLSEVWQASGKLTLNPTDTSCLKMNGCKFTFEPWLEPSAGKFAIGPSGCGPISFTVGGCKGTISPQTIAAAYKAGFSGGKNTVVVNFFTEKLKYTATSGEGVDPCKTGTFSSGHWLGSWEVSAKNLGKAQVDFSLESGGIFIGGEAQNVFEAEQYPLVGMGEQGTGSGQHMLVVGPEGGTAVTCSVAKFESAPTEEGPSFYSALTPTYEQCSIGPFPATVEVGCGFSIELDSHVGSPYTADAGVCLNGKTIKITSSGFGTPRCRVEIGQQSELNGVTFSNIGEGAGRGISASLDVKGISYTVDDLGTFFECADHSGKDGTYKGTATIFG